MKFEEHENKWCKVRLGDVCNTNADSYSKNDEWQFINYLDTGNITANRIDSIQYINLANEKLPSRAKRKVKHNSIIYSTVRPNQRHYGIIKEQPENFLVSTGFTVIDVNPDEVDADFLYFRLSSNDITEKLHAIAEQSTSAYPSIKSSDIENLEVLLPKLPVQRQIAAVLKSIDDKIETNTAINKNLEEQLSLIFKNFFAESISKSTSEECHMLGDLITIIDNRGRTPPLTTETFEYPIIDVGALKGSGRIVDFNNCTKYVDKLTYETWFRNGHPQPWDILLSTVGSVAEMKIYRGTKGCIAQNVVALRATRISPLYLYQYLQFIRSDLIAYNIGSVQPSIKVTHIIKHPIFVPDFKLIKSFEETAKTITNQLYANCNEIELLKALRDTLLHRLLSGEIDVSDIEI